MSEYSTMDETDEEEDESSESCTSSSEKTSSEPTDAESIPDEKYNSDKYPYDKNDIIPIQMRKKVIPVIRPSYFPFVPPYINFCKPDEDAELLPADIKKFMKWRLSTITPVVVRKTVMCTGEYLVL